MYFATQGAKNATCYDAFFIQSARKMHLLQRSRARVACISKMYLWFLQVRLAIFDKGLLAIVFSPIAFRKK